MLAGTFGKVDISGHPGAQLVVVILQPDLDSENLADAVLHRLDVARRELRLAIDLLNRASEFLIPKESTRARTSWPSLM